MRANGVSFKRPPRNLVILRPSLKFWPTLSMFWYITKGLANFTFISMHFSLCKSHWSFIFFAYITINDIANNFKVRKDNLWHLLRGKNKLLAVTIVRDVILLALLVLGYHLHSFVYETPDLFLPLDPVHLEARDSLPPPQCTRHAPLSWSGWVQGRSWAGLWSCRILAVPASTWPGTSSSVTPVKITRGTEKPTRSNHVTFPSKPRAEIPVPFLYLNLCNYTLHIKLHITCNTHCEVNYLLVLLYLFWMNWRYM